MEFPCYHKVALQWCLCDVKKIMPKHKCFKNVHILKQIENNYTLESGTRSPVRSQRRFKPEIANPKFI